MESWLSTARERKGWTQQEAAARVGVSQAYWSLLEHGRRPVPARLLQKLRRHFEVPATMVPVADSETAGDPDMLARALATLGYPGFSHYKPGALVNPAVVLLAALRNSDLETRVVEALPWVAWRFAQMNWPWLLERVRVDDLQNRLGFVVTLARQVASSRGDHAASAALTNVTEQLERSRLVREDTLCRELMTAAERRWLAKARSVDARHWNVLSDLQADRLPYAA